MTEVFIYYEKNREGFLKKYDRVVILYKFSYLPDSVTKIQLINSITS